MSTGDGHLPGTTRYTLEQLRDLWVKAGGPPESAKVAAAVAMGESLGDPQAYNINRDKVTGKQKSIDKGLWQINSIHGDADWTDPMTNAKEAVRLFNERGFEPWSAFKNGSYRMWLVKE